MKKILLILPSLLLMLNSAHAVLVNSLDNHPSPYLKMHANDPVAWQEWGKQAIEQAREQNKLLFVSIGYFACHWCHVMQRESYQNKEIADILNTQFIPVKVDRELNPALDARLIDFVQSTRGYSGWPLNVFITPQGHPLVGLVYLPPADFKSLLTNLTSAWKENPEGLTRDAANAANAFAASTMNTSAKIAESLPDRANRAYVEAIWKTADEFGGGFGTQSKFPSSPQLLTLLRSYQRKADDRVANFLRTTLDRMAKLGLHDLIGGGFFRYTVDPEWHVPHFEKMLYDNAQLARVYLLAADILGVPQYREIALETLDFMISDLRLPSGAFAASLSAIDNQNVEGGYYLYNNDTLQKTLTKPEYLAVKLSWIQESSPTTEDGHLPVIYKEVTTLAKQSGKTEAELKSLLTSAKQKLAALRKQRVLPIDDKQLAAWNGLALTALAEAVKQTGDKRYKDVGEKLYAFLNSKLISGGQITRARDKQGKSLGEAALEDYAYVAAGILDWSEATNNPGLLKQVSPILQQAWQRFYTPNGWKMTEQLLIKYGATEVVLADTALPSASGVLINTSLRLAKTSNDKALLEKSLAALNNGHDLLLGDSYWFATHIAALMES